MKLHRQFLFQAEHSKSATHLHVTKTDSHSVHNQLLSTEIVKSDGFRSILPI